MVIDSMAIATYDSVKQWLTLGREHYQTRDFSKAEQCLRKVVEAGLAYADVYNMLGVIWHDRGDLEAAKAAFQKSLEINPGYAEAALHLAVTLNDLGDYETSRKVYGQAMGTAGRSSAIADPVARGRLANMHADIASAYEDLQWYKEAVDELKKAVNLCPHFPDLVLKLANLYRSQGDFVSAKTQLQTLVRDKPDYVQARITLGLVFLQLGDKEAAMAEWRGALAVEPEHKMAQTYLRIAEKT